jgi:hypothetical protein
MDICKIERNIFKSIKNSNNSNSYNSTANNIQTKNFTYINHNSTEVKNMK